MSKRNLSVGIMIISIFWVLSAACTRASQPAPDSNLPAVSPSPAPTRILPTSSPSATIALPSATPTLIPPTDAPSEPDIPAMLAAITEPELRSSSTSPDGAWTVEIWAYPCTETDSGETYAYEYLLVSDAAGKQTKMADQTINCGGLGAYGLAELLWSPGSRYFYYTDAAYGVPDGCGYWASPILRLDVTDGSSERLGIGAQSPDGKLVAAWNEGELGIWEVDGGQIRSAPLPSMIAVPGPIAWSPDSQSIAYLVSTDYCPPGETSLLRLDLPDLQPEVLLDFSQPAFVGIIWEAADRMTLIDETGNLWEYDFTNPPVPATPTGDLRSLDRLE